MQVLDFFEIKKLLKSTLEDRWMILGCNAFDLISIDSAILASESCQKPILVQLSYGALKSIGGGNWELGLLMVSKHVEAIYENRKNSDDKVKLILGIDHFSTDPFININDFWKALETVLTTNWVNYIMVDASSLPFLENIEISKKARELAHKHNVIIETEINSTPGEEDGEIMQNNNELNIDDLWKYIEEVRPDLIGFEVGLKHGSKPSEHRDIRWEILDKYHGIQEEKPFYVLHGGSSAKMEDVNKGRGKFSKINISSFFKQAAIEYYTQIKNNPSLGDLRFGLRKVLEEKISYYLTQVS